MNGLPPYSSFSRRVGPPKGGRSRSLPRALFPRRARARAESEVTKAGTEGFVDRCTVHRGRCRLKLVFVVRCMRAAHWVHASAVVRSRRSCPTFACTTRSGWVGGGPPGPCVGGGSVQDGPFLSNAWADRIVVWARAPPRARAREGEGGEGGHVAFGLRGNFPTATDLRFGASTRGGP